MNGGGGKAKSDSTAAAKQGYPKQIAKEVKPAAKAAPKKK